MIIATILAVFIALLLLSVPIVFSLGFAALAGLLVADLPLQVIASSVVSGTQSWVLLAIPSFIFAGLLMERCGMSQALVVLARSMVGFLPGGLGMTVVACTYMFADLCGSVIAEVSSLSSLLLKPLQRAGIKKEEAASLIAAGAPMGMLVPPKIFMLVISVVTNTSAVALFIAGFIPAAVMALCLCVLIFFRARRQNWPRDTDPSFAKFVAALGPAIVPMLVPVILFGGLYTGTFTTTETGAVVALYAILAALFYYRNVSWSEIIRIAFDAALLTAAVIFLTAVATIFQYLMGIVGVPAMLAELLRPLEGHAWAFLIAVALISILIGMALEGLPAAVLFVPVVYPVALKLGIHPIHFCIVLTASVGIGLFTPPLGLGLVVALRFAGISAIDHFKYYWPYLSALMVGLLIIILFPEISLFLPRAAGFIK